MKAETSMTKTAIKKALHERQLLDAAFSLFLAQGVEKATVEQITRRANLAKGTFYLYFRDKQDLAGRVVGFWLENLFTEAQEQFEGAQADDAFIEEVTGLIIDTLLFDERLIGFIYKNLTFELFSQVAGGPAGKETAGLLDALIVLLERGGVRLREPRVAVFMMMQLIAGVCYQAVLGGGPLPADRVRPYLLNAIRGMVACL